MKVSKKVDLFSIIFRSVTESIIVALFIVMIVFCYKNKIYINPVVLGLLAVISIFTFAAFYYLVHITKIDRMTKIANIDSFTSFVIRKKIQKKFAYYNSLYINIKDFKYINRIAGNAMGDEIMCKYVKYLKKNLIKNEKIARLGGDNFIVMVYKHRTDDFINVLKNAKIPIINNNVPYDLPVNVRCGIYGLSEKDTVSDVFNKPSIAYLRGKESLFTDFVWFKEDMAKYLYDIKDKSFSFYQALANRQFTVLFQPIVNVVSNKIIGAEALVRWNKDGEILYPDDFIPILEAAGLVSVLDFWVYEEVCKFLKEMELKGINPIKITTNFSKNNLRDNNFASKLLEVISKYDAKKQYLEFEITKSDDYVDFSIVSDFLKKMNEENCNTSIDGFGSGSTTFDMIKDPCLKTVKIDRKLINTLETNDGTNENAILVRNIVHTCFDFKKTVVCEGIENNEQLEILTGMRCSLMQGNYFYKPLTKDEFERRLVEISSN